MEELIIPLIILAGFFKITGDIIRTKETFNDSWFKKFKGNNYIDPELSWKNKWKYGILGYPILSMFGDLCHTMYTLSILSWSTIIYILYKFDDVIKYDKYWPMWTLFIITIFLHGLGANTANGIWRKLFNKK